MRWEGTGKSPVTEQGTEPLSHPSLPERPAELAGRSARSIYRPRGTSQPDGSVYDPSRRAPAAAAAAAVGEGRMGVRGCLVGPNTVLGVSSACLAPLSPGRQVIGLRRQHALKSEPLSRGEQRDSVVHGSIMAKYTWSGL